MADAKPTDHSLRSSAAGRPKCVHVIRHGQAEHNVNDDALEKRDTALTSKGQSQAATLKERVSALQVEIVLTSPILRALETTKGGVASATRVVVVPDARERVSCKSHLCEMPVNPATASSSGDYAGYDWQLATQSLALAGGSVAEWERGLMAVDLESNANIDERGRRLSAWIEGRSEQTLCLGKSDARLAVAHPHL